jgi:cytochrome oxidase Cu insertion factor (SCO1/SenC/PrrC family)
VEDRLTSPRAAQPGWALIALFGIIVITAAWWALAFWPTGTEAEWLARTRAACFGSTRGGLPDAGGWILLIGEPGGMAAVLLASWGSSVERQLRALLTHLAGAAVVSAIVCAVIVGAVAVVVRVAHAATADRGTLGREPALVTRLGTAVPATVLTDQNGRRVSLASLGSQPTLLTFAYGHCTTVCPTIVRELAAARRAARRFDYRIVVVTLDPWRDTPERLGWISAHWELGSGDRVLSGPVGDVETALDALGIGRRRDETTGEIVHSSTVMLLSGAGVISWRLDGVTDELTAMLRRSP